MSEQLPVAHPAQLEQASPERIEQLRSNLERVKRRIGAATEAAGREKAPELIVVTKFFPAADAAALYDLGVRDMGENREQEAGPKARELQSLGKTPRWHFIGQLQSNKAARVLRFANEVHSIDRPALVTAVAKAALRRIEAAPEAEPVGCYVQVDLRSDASVDEDPDAPRGGAVPARIAELADTLASSPGLALRGLMAVAPLGEDPAPAFERLAALSERLRRDHPGATELSAGMSGDLEVAVSYGATRLRIGSDVLGPRPALI